MIDKISGIYRILNTVDKKLYIGSSFNIYNRWKQHKYNLNKNKHVNKHLQRAWNKYGEDVFLFEIIEICNLVVLEEREQYYMDMTKCYNSKQGYNALAKVDRTQLIGELNPFAKYTKGNSPFAKKVICLTTGEVFPSCVDASDTYHINKAHISACCRCDKNRKTCGKLEDNTKLRWMYFDDYLSCTEEEINHRINSFNGSKGIGKTSTPVICLNNKMIFNSISDAIIWSNAQNIGRCCSKKANYSGTHPETGEPLYWMYYVDYQKLA